MTNKYIAVLGTLLVLSAVAIGFQNCAEEIDLSQYTDNSSNNSSSTQPAEITSAPQSLTFTFLAPFSITVEATGRNLVYRWYRADVLLPEVTGNTYAGSQAEDALAGNYRVEVENAHGMDSRTFTVAVSRLANQVSPTISTQVAPLAALYYQRAADNIAFWFQAKVADAQNFNLAQFSVTATGEGLSYQWYYINSAGAATAIAGATDATYSFRLTSLAQVGAYRVNVRNAFGEVTSQASLTATVTAPSVSIQYGGTGGTVFTPQICPVGSWGVGWNLRTGSRVDRLSMICGIPTVVAATAGVGGFGGTPVTLQCPAGRFLIGVNVATGSMVDRIQGVCGDKNGANVTLTAFAGGGGGTLRAIRCPVGYAVSEIRGRSGSVLDAIQVVCTFAY